MSFKGKMELNGVEKDIYRTVFNKTMIKYRLQGLYIENTNRTISNFFFKKEIKVGNVELARQIAHEMAKKAVHKFRLNGHQLKKTTFYTN